MQVVFDTNRIWTTKLPALTRLYPNAKMICCVRNPAWIMDSFEVLIRDNAYRVIGHLQLRHGWYRLFAGRGAGGPTGLVGFAFNALREAVYGEHADRLLLVRYDSLTHNPLGTLAAIYNFVDEPLYAHDPEHIEANYEMVEFDIRLGTPGLHDVRSKVQARARATLLPPDLFSRYEAQAFWQDPEQLPTTVRMLF